MKTVVRAATGPSLVMEAGGFEAMMARVGVGRGNPASNAVQSAVGGGRNKKGALGRFCGDRGGPRAHAPLPDYPSLRARLRTSTAHEPPASAPFALGLFSSLLAPAATTTTSAQLRAALSGASVTVSTGAQPLRPLAPARPSQRHRPPPQPYTCPCRRPCA